MRVTIECSWLRVAVELFPRLFPIQKYPVAGASRSVQRRLRRRIARAMRLNG
jgi:hypothetical protein